MKAILSAALAVLIGVAALTLAHPGEQPAAQPARAEAVTAPATVAIAH